MPTFSLPNSENPSQKLSIQLLSTRYSFDWWVFMLYCVPSLESQVVFDCGRLGGPIEAWLLVSVVSLGAAGILFTLFRILLVRDREKLNPYLVLVLFAAIGLVRGATIHEISHTFGLENDHQIYYRYLIAPLFSAVILGTIAMVISNWRLYQVSLRRLASERSKLRKATEQLQAELTSTYSNLQTQIVDVLTPAFEQLQKRIGEIKDSKSLFIAVEALKNTVDQVVRPLSHRVADVPTDDLIEGNDSINNLDKKQFRYRVAIHFHPLWTAGISGMVSVGPAIVSKSATDAAAVVLYMMATVFATLSVANLIFGNRKFNVVVAGVITTATFLFSALLFISTSRFADADPTTLEAAQILTFTSLLGLTMFVLELAAAWRDQNLLDAQTANDKYVLLNARLRKQVWLTHRRMASILHGQIQGALYAAAIRLNQSGKPNEFLIENVKSEINQTLEMLNDEQKPENRFDVVLHQLFAMWEDVVLFETEFEVEAINALNADSAIAECAIEVIREGINNAIRHGNATRMKLTLGLSGEFISVALFNNGKPLPETVSSGLGSSITTDFAFDWKLANVGDGVELNAKVLR